MESLLKVTPPVTSPKLAGEFIPLEGPIEPSKYRLGPGDRLEFSVWGPVEVHEEVVIGPDGSASIPTVGRFNLGGLSLAQADSLVKVKGRKNYPRGDIDLRLIGVRKVKVSISGAVKAPGVYEVSAIDRVTALIAQAGGLGGEKPEGKAQPFVPSWQRQAEPVDSTGEAALLTTIPLPSLRHLVLYRHTGESLRVDLLRYLRLGDRDHNPVLQDGDHLHIPLMDRGKGVVSVLGAVKSPGEYEFLPGDRVSDLIALAGGALLNDESLKGEVVRFDRSNWRFEVIPVDLPEGGESLLLQPDDRIIVRYDSRYRPRYEVVVMGEVKYPGVYPIIPDTTTLREVIERCGGFTERADLRLAAIYRISPEHEARRREFERLAWTMPSDMSLTEYSFLKARIRQLKPLVEVDFLEVFRGDGGEADITLKEGDEIVVPAIIPMVQVLGEVVKPGWIPYRPGKDYRYYIQEAGGFTPYAKKDRVRLVHPISGRWVKLKHGQPLEMGDVIFVPEKKETDMWQVTKDLLLVASQVATLILVFRAR